VLQFEVKTDKQPRKVARVLPANISNFSCSNSFQIVCIVALTPWPLRCRGRSSIASVEVARRSARKRTYIRFRPADKMSDGVYLTVTLAAATPTFGFGSQACASSTCWRNHGC
jgi:hypothetical protein